MPRTILDASAVLAVILEEPGADVVVEALRSGAAMSTVNVAEVAHNSHGRERLLMRFDLAFPEMRLGLSADAEPRVEPRSSVGRA